MSFVDTVGPFVFFVMLGLAAAIGVVAWIIFYLVPKAREINSRASANVAFSRYHKKAAQLVDEVIAESCADPTFSKRLSGLAYEMKEMGGITGR